MIKVSLINQLRFYCLATYFIGWLVKDIFLWSYMNRLEIKKMLNQMCADEINLIFELIRTDYKDVSISKDASHRILHRENKDYCPYCGSIHVSKNGKTKTGIQKFICVDCHKSHSSTTSTVLFSTKKSYEDWVKFIKCELANWTLKETAEEIGICITTAFYWRHKLYKSISKYIKSITLSDEIQLDATYTRINLKGTKPKNMPRMSKKRGTRSKGKQGMTSEKICIMTGVDSNDNIVLKVAGVGRESIEHYNSIKSQISNPKLLITDQAWGFTTFAKSLNCKLEQIPYSSHKSNNGYDINTINGIHSELQSLLNSKHGVSLKRLQGYLDMFVFRKVMKYTYEANERVFEAYLHSLSCPTPQTIKDIINTAWPVDLYIPYGEYHYGIYKNQ